MDTNKRRTRTRTKLSTFGTDLGSIFRINSNNFNSIPFSFILDKTLQLKEAPIANPIVHSFSSSNISNSLEVFHNNLASVKIVYNLPADIVINPSHEMFLFSRNLFQEPSGTSSSFSLKFTSQEFEFPFNLFNFRGVEELPVRSNSEIMDSQVHTQNSTLRVRALGRKFLGECEQEKASAFIINPQKAFINFPTEIIFKTIWGSERNFNSAIDSRNAQDIVLERETSWRVISDRTEFDKRFGLGFFNNSTGLFNAGNSKLRRKPNYFQFLINKRMQFNIIPNFQFPSFINTDLQSFFISSNSVNNLSSWFNSDFSCCSNSHRLSTNSNFINLSILNSEGISPPNPEGMGIRNATII